MLPPAQPVPSNLLVALEKCLRFLFCPSLLLHPSILGVRRMGVFRGRGPLLPVPSQGNEGLNKYKPLLPKC